MLLLIVLQGVKNGQVHDQVALTVGCTTAVPAAIALGEGPWIGGPFIGVGSWLHIEVTVEQDGGHSFGWFTESNDCF